MNKLFFFTDLPYAAPMSTYYYGAVAGRDLAHVHEILGTNKIDTVELGDTTYEGQITCGEATRAVDPRTYNEDRTVNTEYYQVTDEAKDSEHMQARRAYISKLLQQQYGWQEEAIVVHMDRMLYIPGDCASAAKPMWRGMVKVDAVNELLPIFLTFEGDDDQYFLPTGEKEDYTYQVIRDHDLTPVWHLVDLLEAAEMEECFEEASYLCRKATMSAEAVDGWSEVVEDYGNHSITYYLRPDWKEVQEKAIALYVEEVKALREAQSKAEVEADLPNIDA